MRERVALVTVLALVSVVGGPTQAWGHGFFVDDDVAVSGDCQSIPTACKTIAEAMALPDPDPDLPDVIVVAPGTYTENVVLDNQGGRSILASFTSDPGSHVIVPANPADPTVRITSPSDVVGFSIGGSRPVVVQGPGRVLLDSFASTDVPDGGASVELGAGADGATVDQNTFVDDALGTQIGVQVGPGLAGSPLIAANTFEGLWHAVDARSGNPRMERNRIGGAAIASSVGIDVDGAAGATLTGNLIVDRATGLSVDAADVSLINTTSVDNTVADVALAGGSSLTMNSSVVGSPIAISALSDSCAIQHSAGPSPPVGATGCEIFQVPSQAPGFVDPDAGDFHLTAGSALIDRGDPSAPPFGSLDLDGEQRAVAGSCGGVARRDIGADERVPTCPDPPPVTPEDPIDPPPADGDRRPPDTRIKRATVDGRDLLVRFRADEAGATFRCRLETRAFRACESPTRYGPLKPGRYTFRVKAIDVAGNEDPKPARKRVRIR